MKNDYEVRGEVTAIFLKKKNGSILETIIDTVDMDKAEQYSGTWYEYGGYVKINFRVSDNYTVHYLHRAIMNPLKNLVVDHKNHQTLDNRKSNLRVVTYAQNNQNTSVHQDNNSSGIRGVTLNKKTNKWVANVQVSGKKLNLGYYETIEEANAVVKAFRSKHMPYSQEAQGA